MDTRARNILKLIEDELAVEADDDGARHHDCSDAARTLVRRLSAITGVRPAVRDRGRDPDER